VPEKFPGNQFRRHGGIVCVPSKLVSGIRGPVSKVTPPKNGCCQEGIGKVGGTGPVNWDAKKIKGREGQLRGMKKSLNQDGLSLNLIYHDFYHSQMDGWGNTNYLLTGLRNIFARGTSREPLYSREEGEGRVQVSVGWAIGTIK